MEADNVIQKRICVECGEPFNPPEKKGGKRRETCFTCEAIARKMEPAKGPAGDYADLLRRKMPALTRQEASDLVRIEQSHDDALEDRVTRMIERRKRIVLRLRAEHCRTILESPD